MNNESLKNYMLNEYDYLPDTVSYTHLDVYKRQCIRFQRGVPLLLRVARPCLKLGLGHILSHRARVVFLVCPLLHLPDFIVRNFVLKAAGRADLPAGFTWVFRRRTGAIGKGRARRLQKPAPAVGAALRHKSLLQSQMCIRDRNTGNRIVRCRLR